jgi:hypothetical protein
MRANITSRRRRLRGVDQVFDHYSPVLLPLDGFREFHDVVGSVLPRR